MLNFPGSNGMTACRTSSKAYYSNQKHGPTTNTAMSHNYDSSSFSTLSDGETRFHLDTVSRLSQEVRTATTTGRIQELRQAVSAGEYVPDAAEIAKRLLFLTEG